MGNHNQRKGVDFLVVHNSKMTIVYLVYLKLQEDPDSHSINLCESIDQAERLLLDLVVEEFQICKQTIINKIAILPKWRKYFLLHLETGDYYIKKFLTPERHLIGTLIDLLNLIEYDDDEEHRDSDGYIGVMIPMDTEQFNTRIVTEHEFTHRLNQGLH